MNTLKIGSLFSGYGGLDMAVEAVTGARTAWVSDIDKGACKILAHHYPDVPNMGDISAIDWATVQPVDILTGGYPCQPFSSSGYRQGEDDARHLWPHVREAIRHLRPRLTILENVAGHRSLGFDRVLGDMAEDGLYVRWTSVRAADIGAPHGRERVFIVAYPESVGGDEGHETGHAEAAGASVNGLGNAPRNLGSALRRWGIILGRPCPFPLRVGEFTGNAANPEFWEWLMGIEKGFITDVPELTHAEKIKACGNGVVPQQAAAALRVLLPSIGAAAA